MYPYCGLKKIAFIQQASISQTLQGMRKSSPIFSIKSSSQLTLEGLGVDTRKQTTIFSQLVSYSQGCGGEAPTYKITFPLPIDTGGARGGHIIHTTKALQ